MDSINAIIQLTDSLYSLEGKLISDSNIYKDYIHPFLMPFIVSILSLLIGYWISEKKNQSIIKRERFKEIVSDLSSINQVANELVSNYTTTMGIAAQGGLSNVEVILKEFELRYQKLNSLILNVRWKIDGSQKQIIDNIYEDLFRIKFNVLTITTYERIKSSDVALAGSKMNEHQDNIETIKNRIIANIKGLENRMETIWNNN